jgi:UDP-N-acetylenolpyruvoylglucosamine reductase
VPDRAATPTAPALAELTTLRLGGPARRLLSVNSADALIDAVSRCDRDGEPVLVLAGGSNVVVADEGFAGTVVRIVSTGIQIESDDAYSGVALRVAAGQPWDDVVVPAVTEGWVGLEALSGIPGSTGATPVQNVGAYGQEVSQSVSLVRTWDRKQGRVRSLATVDCAFSYRDSRLKAERFRGGPRFVVLEVTYRLRLGTLSAPVRYGELARALGVELGRRAPLGDVRAAVLELRRGKGMAGRRRPRHLERRVVLHQSRAELGRRRTTAGRGAALARGGREDQDQCRVADRAGGIRPGPRPARAGEPVHQAHAGPDQPRVGAHRRRAGAGPRGARRRPGGVRAGACTGTRAGRLHPLIAGAATATSGEH